MILLEYSELILKAIDSSGKSTYAISKATGITESAFSNWRKRPTSKMDLSNVCKIANFLGIAVDVLIVGTGNVKEAKSYSKLSSSEEQLLKYYDLMTDFEKGEILGEMKSITKDRTEDFSPNIA